MPNIIVLSPEGEIVENPFNYLTNNFGYDYATALYQFNSRYGVSTLNLNKIYNNSPTESKTVREQNFLNSDASLGVKSLKVNQASLSEFKKQNNLTDYDTSDVNGINYNNGYSRANSTRGSAREFCRLG